jgi:phosphoribosylglycinamide formyltransferase-1
MNIAVFVSGSGTNLQAIIDAVNSGYINAKIAIVISDKGDAYALERAKKAGIETLFMDPKIFKSKEDYDKAIIKYLKDQNVELICLAGYMRVLTPHFVRVFKDRIMNIHPALLPSFKGVNGVKDALDYGVKVTGPTVHFVTEEVDAGPIIMQSAIGVKDDDTEDSLREKVHEEEHRIYPRAIKDFVEGKLEVRGRRVIHTQTDNRQP